jgi:hypothetical protein
VSKFKKFKPKDKITHDTRHYPRVTKINQVWYEEMLFPENAAENQSSDERIGLVFKHQVPKRKQGLWGAVWQQMTGWGR